MKQNAALQNGNQYEYHLAQDPPGSADPNPNGTSNLLLNQKGLSVAVPDQNAQSINQAGKPSSSNMTSLHSKAKNGQPGQNYKAGTSTNNSMIVQHTSIIESNAHKQNSSSSKSKPSADITPNKSGKNRLSNQRV